MLTPTSLRLPARSAGLLVALFVGGCFFPEYTFDDGGSGGSTTTNTGGGSSTTTTTSTTTTSASGGGGAGSGGSSSTGMMDLEDCTNGVDDDADGDVDCADAGCATKASCVPPTPTDWTGPFAVYEGPSSGFNGCPADFPDASYQGNTGIMADPASCTTCMCDLPTGEVCDLPDDLFVHDAACNAQDFCSGDMPIPPSWNGSCDGSGAFPAGQTTCGMNASMMCDTSTGVACNQSVSMAAMTVVPGTCTHGTSTPTKTNPTWENVFVACGGPANTAIGCNGAFSCLPKPPAGYLSGLCISAPGVQPCPAGSFSNQHLAYEGFLDDRTCSDCSCDMSTGATCSATVNVYSNGQVNVCNVGPIATLSISTAGGDCKALTGNPAVGSHTATVTGPSGGMCMAHGGAPIGGATPDPAMATTFCCL
jgi:hypothetical protein